MSTYYINDVITGLRQACWPKLLAPTWLPNHYNGGQSDLPSSVPSLCPTNVLVSTNSSWIPAFKPRPACITLNQVTSAFLTAERPYIMAKMALFIPSQTRYNLIIPPAPGIYFVNRLSPFPTAGPARTPGWSTHSRCRVHPWLHPMSSIGKTRYYPLTPSIVRLRRAVQKHPEDNHAGDDAAGDELELVASAVDSLQHISDRLGGLFGIT
ncbi:uncharacterized protein BCR38DRAFT_479247 [Pseudomassariella vexata]|uniref:Uncharacterized protein n=1 Tax=Pseudomassariella vexata TaxID=1141098 RepID=A0A1Y2D7N9_9PEZI|nr:uncharacterized protein BCR38DRAFT_479247 [Pseudomassariella vexata]ORY55126.1 hypothetical protein BCR38DRAFT_479247 [Pseudomassariella vexata]